MFNVLIFLLIIYIPGVYAGPLEDAYQDGANLARANQNKPLEKVKELPPSTNFEKFTENPQELKYYHGITSTSAKELREAGEKAYNYDDNDEKNIGYQAALKSFKKNPSSPYRIDPSNQNDPIISRAKNIMAYTQYMVGDSNSQNKADCKEVEVCHIEYLKKTCIEPRPIKRVCNRIPYVDIVNDAYPGCQMHSSPGSVSDCLAGGVQIPFYRGTGYGKIVIPKNRGARVGFSDSRHPYYYITATNETNGQVVIPRRQVSNGYYIELPLSKTQDQTFSFVVERWDRCYCDQPGRMNIYIDYNRKIADIKWKEEACRDI